MDESIDNSLIKHVEQPLIPDNLNSFETFNESAWKEAEPTLTHWKEKLRNYTERKSGQINLAINNIALLYGINPPSKITVNLNYFPEKDRESGEPTDQGDKDKTTNKSHGDIVYWVSKRTILPNDTQDYIENEMPAETMSRIIHEAEHSFFQNESFEKLIKDAEKIEEINDLLKKILPSQKQYTEFTNELLTSYFDAYSLDILQGDSIIKNEGENIFDFVVNKGDFCEILDNTIKSDVETWKGNGPRTDLRIAWKERLGNLPQGYNETPKTEPVNQENNYHIPSVYQIGRGLDHSLINEYLNSGKQMDIDFIRRVYEQVDNNLFKKEADQIDEK